MIIVMLRGGAMGKEQERVRPMKTPLLAFKSFFILGAERLLGAKIYHIVVSYSEKTTAVTERRGVRKIALEEPLELY